MMSRITAALLLISAVALPVLAAEDVVISEQLAERERYQQQLQTLELDWGRFDNRLVETLVQQARLSMSMNEFDQAQQSLDRAVQILRINDGLYTPDQFPLLLLQVENAAQRGDWIHANATLDHLYWLYVNKHRGIDADLIQELRSLAAFHLEAVAADSEDQQAKHFRKALEISAVSLQVAHHVWGEQDIRLADLNYDLVKQFYLQAVAVDRGSRTGYELREVAPGSSWIRSRQTAMRSYYQRGLGLLQQSSDLFRAQNPPDLQGEAMATLYLADWQILFTRDAAADTYQQAYGQLLAAGVESATLAEFFAEPVLLPQPRFHSNVISALGEREDPTAAPNLPDDAQAGTALRFNEWSTAFPDVQFPFPHALVRFHDDAAWGSVLVSFNLVGLNKVSRWVNGRYVTRLSVPGNLEILSQGSEPQLQMDSVTEKLHSLHFRPRLVQGIPEPAQGTLQYSFSTR